MRIALAVGLVLRLAALFLYLSSNGWKGETWEYEELALSLYRGDGYLYFHHGVPLRSAYMPLFPMICAFLHWISGAGLWLFYAFHLACAAALIAAIYSLARDIWGERAARLAALFVAIEPALIVYQSYKVEAVGLASLLLVLSLLMFRRHADSGRAHDAISAGILAALATLTRPDMIIFWLAPIAWTARRRLAPNALRGLTLTALAFTVVLSPWVARNFLIHGRFMPATTLSGVNLWIGNNPNSTGTPWARNGQTQWQAAPDEFRSAIKAGPELLTDDLYKREALAHIKGFPAEAGIRWMKTFAYFWWFAPDYSKRLYYGWMPDLGWVGYRIFFACLLVLILLGSVAAARERAETVGWIWACAIGLAILHSVHFVEGRHRLIVLPLLLIIAARGWTELGALRIRR